MNSNECRRPSYEGLVGLGRSGRERIGIISLCLVIEGTAGGKEDKSFATTFGTKIGEEEDGWKEGGKKCSVPAIRVFFFVRAKSFIPPSFFSFSLSSPARYREASE